MKIDITLESDRSLKDNVQSVAKFALSQIMRRERSGTVRNRHEGYGIAAEYFVGLRRNVKAAEADMKGMLSLLPNGEGDFINVCGDLYNSAIEIAASAIRLAAQSQRIMDDLYNLAPRTPVEEYLDGCGDGEDGDGFDDAGTADGWDEQDGMDEIDMDDEEDQ